MHLTHQLQLEIEMFEQNQGVIRMPVYRCNIHFRNRQAILKSPVAQKIIQNEKTEFQGIEEVRKCIKHYDAFLDLLDEG